LSSTRALGLALVNGLNLVPKPAARIIAFICSFAEILEAQVAELDFDAGFGAEAFG
jgi:hypothetical protein